MSSFSLDEVPQSDRRRRSVGIIVMSLFMISMQNLKYLDLTTFVKCLIDIQTINYLFKHGFKIPCLYI